MAATFDDFEKLAVLVPTFQRPIGLARLLRAIDEVVIPDGLRDLQIFVVDNDPAGSARELCEEFASRVSYSLHYSIEKRRGIPQTRNSLLAVGMAAADLVAFIDDDEVPERDWLVEAVRALRDYSADAVTGPCLSMFNRPPPDWIAAGGFFDRPRFADGLELRTGYTGNALFRSSALARMPTLFDENLALTGGEDSEFFRRFSLAGYRTVWADRAIVSDEVPESCVALGWILARALRTGGTETYVARKFDPVLGAWSRSVLHGGYCIAKGLALTLTAPLRMQSAAVAARGLQLASFGAGRVAGVFGFHHEAYRTTHGN
jgi:succinoglycan biosynthesis protein ExoM